MGESSQNILIEGRYYTSAGCEPVSALVETAIKRFKNIFI